MLRLQPHLYLSLPRNYKSSQFRRMYDLGHIDFLAIQDVKKGLTWKTPLRHVDIKQWLPIFVGGVQEYQVCLGVLSIGEYFLSPFKAIWDSPGELQSSVLRASHSVNHPKQYLSRSIHFHELKFECRSTRH